VVATLDTSVVTKDPLPPAQQYRDAHDAAPVIIDLHADTLVQPDKGAVNERLLTNTKRAGHVDVPRLIQGNVALQVFAVGIKGSADILGNAVPLVTGKFVDDAGVQHSRWDYERDPNVPDYDDPLKPYARTYAPLGIPREPGTYAFRLQNRNCKTWYDGGNWDPFVWGTTPACPEFDPACMYLERYLDLAKRLRDADAADARLTVVTSRAELAQLLSNRKINRNQVGGLLSTEGLYFRSDVSTPAGFNKLNDTIAELYGAGFRMFSLTHFLDNDHAGSSTGMGRASSSDGRDLSLAGRVLAEQVFARGGVLDVAHASRATVASMAALARAHRQPLVFSHGGISDIPGVQGECVNPRNIDAAQIRDIASTGGVVGIGLGAEFVCSTLPTAWALAVRHVVDAIDATPLTLFKQPGGTLLHGVDHVALGSDFDGGVKTFTDVANLNQYTRALMCNKTLFTPDCLVRPFTAEEAYKILGGNALRVLQAALPAN
jgi:microsomal dipeptidase-like Zn-dependent dipeptidase